MSSKGCRILLCATDLKREIQIRIYILILLVLLLRLIKIAMCQVCFLLLNRPIYVYKPIIWICVSYPTGFSVSLLMAGACCICTSNTTERIFEQPAQLFAPNEYPRVSTLLVNNK